jgi:hypothetical protein
MFKTLAIITMLCSATALETLRQKNIGNDSPMNQERLTDATSENSQTLKEGMGLLEVEKTLNGEGREQRMVRSIKPETADPLDWNVGWEIARTYDSEQNGTRRPVTAVFEAWTDDSSNGRPPESAFRLVRWN